MKVKVINHLIAATISLIIIVQCVQCTYVFISRANKVQVYGWLFLSSTLVDFINKSLIIPSAFSYTSLHFPFNHNPQLLSICAVEVVPTLMLQRAARWKKNGAC